VGFHKPGETLASKEAQTSQLLQQVIADDLLQYGMIPEFVGRLPMTVSVDPLDEDTLVAVLTEPKNSIVKQFKRLFELDGVELQFTPEALRAAARDAMKLRPRRAAYAPSSSRCSVMYEVPAGPGSCGASSTPTASPGHTPLLLMRRFAVAWASRGGREVGLTHFP
jgi:ATP-dependent Clp protease ATP-binding subunit ClpX